MKPIFSLKKHSTRWLSIVYAALFFISEKSAAQKLLSLEPVDSLQKVRFWTATAAGSGIYVGSLVWLNRAWYADFPRTDFHFFNDNREWLQMDKLGHFFTTYSDARLTGAAARWTGLSQRRSAWVGFGIGHFLQGTFEVLDGFSSSYGFSWGDVGCNVLGGGLFLGQELGWREQRIVVKMSGWPVRYDQSPIYSVDNQHVTTLSARAEELYGSGFVNLFLKNYNTLNIWTSVNLRSFSPRKESSKMPPWLNLAVGYGSNNLFRGEPIYEWNDPKTGALFKIDPLKYPRERQFFLSPDIDLRRIRVKNRFLKALLGAANVFKIPAPALEITSGGRVRFHAIHF